MTGMTCNLCARKHKCRLTEQRFPVDRKAGRQLAPTLKHRIFPTSPRSAARAASTLFPCSAALMSETAARPPYRPPQLAARHLVRSCVARSRIVSAPIAPRPLRPRRTSALDELAAELERRARKLANVAIPSISMLAMDVMILAVRRRKRTQ